MLSFTYMHFVTNVPVTVNLEQYANIAFPLYITTFPVFSIARIATALLILGVFIQHSGEFTRFLHRLGAAYLMYYLWLDSTGVFFRRFSVDAFLEVMQEDSVFFRLFFRYGTLIVALFFFGVAERFFLSKRGPREFSILIFFLHFGGLFVLRLHTLRDLLIALERVTLVSYVLATFERQNRFSTYAGVQYFLLGSLPSARLILSFGLFYLQGGSLAVQDLDMLFGFVVNLIGAGVSVSTLIEQQRNIISNNFNGVSDLSDQGNIQPANWSTNYSVNSFNDYFVQTDIEGLFSSVSPVVALTLRGLVFLFFNLLFKLTAAPFHVWAPSVYGKAPIASVTFLSIYSKARVLFFLFKLLNTFLHSFSFFTLVFLLVCGVLSVFIGRVGAFTEKRIKRFFVYSSRGHVGFRLVGISLNTLEGASSAFHYLAVYIISSLLRWFFLLNRGREKNHLSHFAELKVQNPFRALVFAFLVFSMSGIPPFGGFFIKLDVLSALLEDSHFFTNYVLFFFTVASFFYYLRLIKIRFFDLNDSSNVAVRVSTSASLIEERPIFRGRVWRRIAIILVLGGYLFIVQQPIFAIISDTLSSLYL